MSRKSLTFRAHAKMATALTNLGKVRRRTVNQLITEAVNEYLLRRHPEERELEDQLARLREYRRRDPQFEKAIRAFVKDELEHDDPAEGRPEKPKSTTLQKEIRALLNG
jgi:predicted transcriptional regulator